MTKQIMIRVSEIEFSEIEELVKCGYGRTKADFVKSSTVLGIAAAKNKMTINGNLRGAKNE